MNGIVLVGRATLRFFREADMVLLLLSLACSILGIILISSVVYSFPEGTTEVYVQIGAVVIGVALFILFSYVDIDIIADKSWFLFIFSMLFISTLLIWGEGDGIGQRAWLRFFGIGVQPGEIVKIPFIIIMARMMATFKEKRTLNSIFSILQVAVIFALMFGAVLELSEDLGTALVYFAIFAIMIFIAGLKLRWFVFGSVAIAAVSPFLWNTLTERQQERIMAPFFPLEVDPTGEGVLWQTHQSLRAISSGGFLGQGLGNGRFTQAGSVPAQHTDFIFSAAGEELGFVGLILIIALLVAIIIRCIFVGIKSNNPLGLLVCSGVTAMIIFQSIVNIGMTIGFMPVIGITLPFFSYGGSATVTMFAAMGIVSGIKMRPKPVRFRNL